MNNWKTSLICAMLLASVIMLAACGNEARSSEDRIADTLTVEQEVMPSPDPAASVDNLLGEWKDINAEDRYAKISKAEQGYLFEDNEGQYPAEFKHGVLEVKVSDTDMAEVYFAAATGHMYSVYQGNSTEFIKK